MSKPTPAPTANAKGPCPTIILIVGRPGTGSLPRTFAPPDHQHQAPEKEKDHIIKTAAKLIKMAYSQKILIGHHIPLPLCGHL